MKGNLREYCKKREHRNSKDCSELQRKIRSNIAGTREKERNVRKYRMITKRQTKKKKKR